MLGSARGGVRSQVIGDLDDFSLRFRVTPAPNVPRARKAKVEEGSGTGVAEKLMGNSLSSDPKFSEPGINGGAEKTSR